MTEYLFYTTEGFTQDPNGNDIENGQLLGRAFGENQSQALKNLLEENPWIVAHGYNPYKAICQELASSKK